MYSEARSGPSICWRVARNLLCLALLAPVFQIASAQGTAVVRVDPPSGDLELGQSVRVAIQVEGAADVFGAEVRLSYDAAMFEILDADDGKPGVQLVPGDFLPVGQGFLVANEADNEAGQLIYALTLLAPAAPSSGDGVLVAFDLQAKGLGDGALALESVILASADGVSLPVSTEDGQMVVTAPATPIPTASPTAAAIPTDEPEPTDTLPPGVTATAEPGQTPSVPAASPTTADPRQGPTGESATQGAEPSRAPEGSEESGTEAATPASSPAPSGDSPTEAPGVRTTAGDASVPTAAPGADDALGSEETTEDEAAQPQDEVATGQLTAGSEAERTETTIDSSESRSDQILLLALIGAGGLLLLAAGGLILRRNLSLQSEEDDYVS